MTSSATPFATALLEEIERNDSLRERLRRLLAPSTSATRHDRRNLPAGCPSVDVFYRECRTGRVPGAVKIGRAWSCTADQWAARKRPPRMTSEERARARANAKKVRETKHAAPELPDVRSDVLAMLGAERAS